MKYLFRSFGYPMILIACLMPMKSHAIIDMRNANFSETWSDMILKKSSFSLRLDRTYNSRTLFSGMFGFGWCSDFETYLKVTAENSLRVTECGAGFEVNFYPQGSSKTEFTETIKKIMAEVKNRNKGKDKAYFDKLESDLKIDVGLRDEFAKQLKINGTVKANAKYLADGKSNDYIVLKGNEYFRYLSNGTFQKFNKSGRLLQISDRNNNGIKLSYAGDKLVNIMDDSGSSIQIKYYEGSKFIKMAVGTNGLKSIYKFKGENLIEVINSSNQTTQYEYDDLYNVTLIKYPDKTTAALTYDKDKDWVMSYRDRRGCLETYKYTDSEKDPINNYTSDVEKVCKGKVTNKSSYEFLYSTNKEGKRYLAKTTSNVNGKITDTEYHPLFGLPISINEDGFLKKYDYNSEGQLSERVELNAIFQYKYDKVCSKVNQVVVFEIPPLKGSVANNSSNQKNNRQPSKADTKAATDNKKQTTEFLYEPKRCTLLSARNSLGQTVKLNYDIRGRITRIEDQSKKELTITYEEQFGKPHVVNRPGLGSIKFKYKPDGTPVLSPNEDPVIASQVLNIFSNLLEIIAPATTESNNI